MIVLQRRIFERQRAIIEARESHPSKGFTRYRNEYRRAVAGYIAESGFGALCDAVAHARVAYVSDYHTLKLAQRTFVKLIRGVMHQVDNICLAMEFVGAEHQRHLDRYLEQKITETTFLRRIQYKEQWPYDIWPNFQPIFELARNEGFPVVALDSDFTLSLIERDKLSATRIARAGATYPEATILVFAGQMHLAPSHLPSAVDREFIRLGMSAPERVIVYQNAAEIYWQLAREGREEVEVVKVDSESYCVNNTPPLAQQLSYLHWVQYDEELLEYAELESTVRSLIRNLGRFFGLKMSRPAEEVRVLMPGDLELVNVLRGGGMNAEKIEQLLAHVEAEQSAFIPELNLIYLATLSVNHAAEEAAHYVKHHASGGQLPLELRDRFYYLVLNEACGFLGSKVVNPKRKTDHAGKLRQVVARARNKKRKLAEEKAAAVALSHLAWERGQTKRWNAAPAIKQPAVFNAAAHILGYMLGDRLYYGLTDGAIAKREIRNLFVAPLDREGEALEKYLKLAASLRQVRIPRRI